MAANPIKYRNQTYVVGVYVKASMGIEEWEVRGSNLHYTGEGESQQLNITNPKKQVVFSIPQYQLAYVYQKQAAHISKPHVKNSASNKVAGVKHLAVIKD